MNNLNKIKSLGSYSIPVKFLQIHVDVLKQPLIYLINLSFQQSFKTARVTPFLKKKILNFLLIIVPSLFCQFLAKCIKNVCILAFTRFRQNINCFLKSNLVLETTTLQAIH